MSTVIRRFVHDALPGRVRFGAGRLAEVPEEVSALELQRVLVVTTPPQAADARRLGELIGGACAGVFTEAALHTPVAVTEKAMAEVEQLQIDGVVALGGGSSIGLAKAIALRTDLPQIAVPTTYAGSEMTPVIGETRDGAKVTQTTRKVLPEVVIYDPELTVTLPVLISGTSGINAIAHAVEALYARDRNPLVVMWAREGIRALAQALPRIAQDPHDLDARAAAQYGAWLCGMCLAAGGMALHHKLCHTLGGSYDLSHAETHTVLLPHVIAYNATGAPEAIGTLREVLDHTDPALAIQEIARAMGAPLALRDLGFSETDIDDAVERALANPYWNPRPLERPALRTLLQRAWAGDPPAQL